MKKVLALIVASTIIATAFSQTTPLWLRYPAISPDGKTIAFGYKGDIYRVDATGGTASPLGKENRPTENLQLEPDIKVTLPYEDLLNGKDTQIEAAVQEMLKEISDKKVASNLESKR